MAWSTGRFLEMADQHLDPTGVEWLECPCCSWESVHGEILCAACEVPWPCEEPNPESGCEPAWMFSEDMGEPIRCPNPECGCLIGVSVTDDVAYSTLVCEMDSQVRAACSCVECADV